MTMETKFTPGPWTSQPSKKPRDGEYDWGIVADGYIIAEAYGRVAKDVRPDAHANAALIAAAPDLYAALENFVVTLAASNSIEHLGPRHGRAIEDAKAALSKARGES